MAIKPLKKKTVKSKPKTESEEKDSPDVAEQSQSLIDDTIARIEQQYGSGIVMRMGVNKIPMKKVDVISTGSISLDIALGYGGLPRGRIVELWGREGCVHEDTIVRCLVRNEKNNDIKKHIPIKDLYERFKGGEKIRIISVNQDGQKSANTIADVVKCGVKKCAHIKTHNGKELICTLDHKIMTEYGEFVPVSDLKINSTIVTSAHSMYAEKQVILDRIKQRHLIDPAETYDVKCFFPLNNYIANDIVVHNSGKTTMSLHTVANAQRQKGTCVFIDAEHALDMTYARNIGVNEQDLILCQPDYGEQGLDIVSQFIKDKSVNCIVVDSVAALTPRAEIEGEMGDIHVGLQARMMSQAMRKLTAEVSKSNALVIFINQVRDRIGISYGDKGTTTGGNALKFYASVRLEIKRIGAVRKGGGSTGDIIGNRTAVKVVKNKLAPPFRTVEFDLIYGQGINYLGDVIDLALQKGLLKRQGAFYSYDGETIGQGREKAKSFLEENPKIANELVRKLKGVLP